MCIYPYCKRYIYISIAKCVYVRIAKGVYISVFQKVYTCGLQLITVSLPLTVDCYISQLQAC